ncbi:MAG: hypothetical protein GY861_26345 [bacterium]|nr:hypothetical protein [bacterium]
MTNNAIDNNQIESVVVKLMDLEQSIDDKQVVDIKSKLVDIQLILCEMMVAPLPRPVVLVPDDLSVPISNAS